MNHRTNLSFAFCILFFYRVPQSYVYGSPYLGAATTASSAGLVPIPATQLSHAAAIAAATNQFYEYQVSIRHVMLWTRNVRPNAMKINRNNLKFKQNAVAAAAAAPYPGQYAGFEAYPYTTAAAAAGTYILIHPYDCLDHSMEM